MGWFGDLVHWATSWGNTMGEELRKTEQRNLALLVGINEYASRYITPLRGCVNDVWLVRRTLIKHYGFVPDDIRVIIDDRATYDKLESRMEWLANEAGDGDNVLFYYSGHGSQCRDRDGDELDDSLDELLVVHDHDWDFPFTDDKLRDLLLNFRPGVSLAVIVDACHSGTITRSSPAVDPDSFGKNYSAQRFVPPPFDIEARTDDRSDLPKRHFGECFKDVDELHCVSLSGCRDDQTSQETVFRLDNDLKTHGVLTKLLCETLVAHSGDKVTWEQIHSTVSAMIQSYGFRQEPQLNGSVKAMTAIPFERR